MSTGDATPRSSTHLRACRSTARASRLPDSSRASCSRCRGSFRTSGSTPSSVPSTLCPGSRLVVVGTGPDRSRLEAMAGPGVTFLGSVGRRLPPMAVRERRGVGDGRPRRLRPRTARGDAVRDAGGGRARRADSSRRWSRARPACSSARRRRSRFGAASSIFARPVGIGTQSRHAPRPSPGWRSRIGSARSSPGAAAGDAELSAA